MKKVLFDGIATQGQGEVSYHGGSEYAKFILFEAVKRGLKFDIVIDPDRFTHPEIETLLRDNPPGKVLHASSNEDIYALADDYDVFYSALPYSYTEYSAQATFVAVVHGLRHIEMPWDKFRPMFEHGPRKLIAKIVNHSSYLQEMVRKRQLNMMRPLFNISNAKYVTVSRHSKYAILNYFPEISENRIKVFQSPFSVGEYDPNAEKPKEKYFLLISANRYVKNIPRALRAFDRLFSQDRLADAKVVVVGCDKENMFDSMLINRHRFEMLPYLHPQELDRYYRDAFVFVYPSLNEGFGYPPLQAMAYGVPVIAAASTSIPEVCGNAALYFVPTDEAELANRILRIYHEEELREQLRERGFQRVKTILKQQQEEIQDEIDYIFK